MSGIRSSAAMRLGTALDDRHLGAAPLEQRRHREDVAEVVVDDEDLARPAIGLGRRDAVGAVGARRATASASGCSSAIGAAGDGRRRGAVSAAGRGGRGRRRAPPGR